MVCQWFNLKTAGTVFSSLVSKLVATVFSVLASKPVEMVSPGLPSKSVARVSQFGPQNRQLWFVDLCLKITTTVSWFEPQNQAGFGLSVASQNRREDAAAWDTPRDLAACFAWKQVGLGFPSLPQNWRRSDGGWYMWHHRGSRMRIKLKMDGSMR
jgi:hypothetical protein